MAVLPILRWPAPMLTARAAVVEGVTEGIRALAADMLATMYAAEGRGLAAPQVGVSQRLFVMDAGWKSGAPSAAVCINPEILWQSAVTAYGVEGCLSIPSPLPLIARPQAIVLRWQDLDGTTHQARLAGAAAIIAQHEADHLDGKLTLDHLPDAARTEMEAAL